MFPLKKPQDDFAMQRAAMRNQQQSTQEKEEEKNYEEDDDNCPSYGYRYLERFCDTGTILFEIVDEEIADGSDKVCGYIIGKPNHTPTVLFDECWEYDDDDIAYLTAEVQKFLNAL